MRITQAEMNCMARNSRHPFQRAKLEKMMEMGWTVYSHQEKYGVELFFLSWNGTSGVCYPNGLFVRALSGRKTITFSWTKARDYAEATIPAGA